MVRFVCVCLASILYRFDSCCFAGLAFNDILVLPLILHPRVNVTNVCIIIFFFINAVQGDFLYHNLRATDCRRRSVSVARYKEHIS